MNMPHDVFEVAMDLGDLPEGVRADLREHFGIAQLLFCLENSDAPDGLGYDRSRSIPASLRQEEPVERDEEVLPPGYYISHDPEFIFIYDEADRIAERTTRNTSDGEITHLAWEHYCYRSGTICRATPLEPGLVSTGEAERESA